jgi:hypothetical protein
MKGYLVTEEAIRETKPSHFELILTKLKKVTDKGKKYPVVFQIPQNFDPESNPFAVANIHKIKELFNNLISVKDRTLQTVPQNINHEKLYKIRPNVVYLPMTSDQKIALAGLASLAILFFVMAEIGYTALIFIATIATAILMGFNNSVGIFSEENEFEVHHHRSYLTDPSHSLDPYNVWHGPRDFE